jgi:anti-anti-sigma factor
VKEKFMQIETRQLPNILVVDMTGRLDSGSSGAAHDALVGFGKSGAKKIVLNLGKLDSVSSAGLRVILTLAKLLQTSRGELRICSGNGAVKEVLETSGFNHLIKIFDDEASALKSWD